jgi:DNA invertase Pin-like site-specific DNA recombinase
MKKAIIYVRGHKEKMQEIFCRLYASDKGYKIIYVTNNIDDVNLCDIMLVANPSRISRNHLEYEKIVNKLKDRGITVESAIHHDNAVDNYLLTKDLFE